MDSLPVHSSNVASVGYEPETSILEIELKDRDRGGARRDGFRAGEGPEKPEHASNDPA
jgi:hypothetical protein